MPEADNNSAPCAHIEDHDLERILRVVDENLAGRQLLEPQRSPSFKPKAAQPEPSHLQKHLNSLRAMRAPFYVLEGPLRAALSWVLNIPLHLVGKRQLRFNDRLVDYLTILTRHVNDMHDWVSAMAEDMDEQARSIRQLREEVERLADTRSKPTSEAPAEGDDPPRPADAAGT